MDTISHDPQLLGEYQPFGRPLHVWAARAPLPDDERFTAYTSELAEGERAQLARIVTGAARAQFVTGRALAREVLARELRTTRSRIRFAADASGRPCLAEPLGTGIDFNLSHSGRLTLLAVTRGSRVGVDVEQTAVERDFSGVAMGFFSPAEYEQWSLADTADRRSLWYRIWTRREAYVKATGLGLRDIGDDHHGRGSAWVDIALEPAPGHVGCAVLLNRP
ncbi:4'-phosphopantetheinyl transferase family protein [Streptomyces sp. NPDC018610]|uniref:4'-phosphopantetheinyl transferase family protein n=1 Tax=Streptomyces sp. NPDC018610 TaxID=3365049 RepID=UPI00379BAEA3